MSWQLSLPGLEQTKSHEFAFGEARDEAALALQETVVAPLLHLGTLAATGPETESFLQGQLSNDVSKLTDTKAQLASYNSPKGRMLAVIHSYRGDKSHFLELHASLVETILKRLRMYVMRAKTTLDDVSETSAILGVSGPTAAEAIKNSGLGLPAEPRDCVWSGETCVIRRRNAGEHPRYTIHVPVSKALDLWNQLSAVASPVGTAAWRLLDIEAGIPTVYPQTSDRFVAQMCNLEKLGGISFDKGCYTGQEVIARVHYRGAVKRTMVAIDHPDAGLEPGTRLDEPAGAEVVVAAPSASGGSRALVVATVSKDGE